jgi:hypothetical protein
MPAKQSGSITPGPERPLAYYASVAHVARVYDYLLGGKDNFAVDREAAEQAKQTIPRSHQEVARFFAGLDLLEPGLVRVPQWRPAPDGDTSVPAQMWGGIARKPAL